MKTFYTYLWLRENGTPYYVGKGSNRRAFRKGSPPRKRILLQEFSSEEDAFAAEIFFISYYGRLDLGTGILRNRTNGGDGIVGWAFQKEHLSQRGKVAAESGWLAKARSKLTFEMCSLAGKQGGPLGGKKGGKVQGLRNVLSGHIRKIATETSCSEGGVAANHVRWHIARNRISSTCHLCQKALAVKSSGRKQAVHEDKDSQRVVVGVQGVSAQCGGTSPKTREEGTYVSAQADGCGDGGLSGETPGRV